MKLVFLLLILFSNLSIGYSQHVLDSQTKVSSESNEAEVTFKLFPTQNYWTFLKLNTRNGKMWQVHFSVDNDGVSGEVILNSKVLVPKYEERDNRFNLYPTNNIYSFILLDQINGNTYHVQWSMEENYRWVLPLY